MKKQSIILVFPGQGSQAPGMAVGWQASPAARLVLEEASEALNLNLAALMAPEADTATLTQTQNAQPALLVVGLMAAAALAEATSNPLASLAAMVAGHSVGEYTAVAAAGGFSVTQAVRLVQVRGNAMAAAQTSSGAGGMSAVLGLSLEQIEAALAAHPGVTLANDNCVGQGVVAGKLDDLPAAEEALKAAGAKRVLRLPVGGAFHTALQQGPAQAVKAALQAALPAPLSLPCLMNFTAQAHDKNNEIANNLIAQITSRVRWREAMLLAAAQGITQVLELGCGKVLTGLAPRCDDRLGAVSIAGQEDLLRWLDQNPYTT